MFTLKSKNETSKLPGIGFEFYSAPKKESRKGASNLGTLHELGFKTIPFQSRYSIKMDYMQRRKDRSILNTLIP